MAAKDPDTMYIEKYNIANIISKFRKKETIHVLNINVFFGQNILSQRLNNTPAVHNFKHPKVPLVSFTFIVLLNSSPFSHQTFSAWLSWATTPHRGCDNVEI